MPLLTAGYWHTTFWPDSFWDDNYWLDAQVIYFVLSLVSEVVNRMSFESDFEDSLSLVSEVTDRIFLISDINLE